MRALSFAKHPNDHFLKLKEDLITKRFYVVKRSGPTVFTLKEEEGEIFKVILGNPHKCTCKISIENLDTVLCVHKVFCLIKVLRVMDSSPMCWQAALTDGEIVQMLDGVFSAKKPEPKRMRKIDSKEDATTSESSSPVVSRQQLCNSEDDICPICQDLLSIEQALSWCRVGCGNNIHAKCMLLYAQHANSKKDTAILCPLCRSDWGPMALHQIREDGKSNNSRRPRPIHCISCHVPIRQLFYRCVECSQKSNFHVKVFANYADFCQRCYDGLQREHIKCHFLQADASLSLSDHTWEPVAKVRYHNNEELMRNLQSRELGPMDYELLLSMDQHYKPPITSILVDCLAQSHKLPTSCWCTSNGANIPSKTLLRELPCCGTSVHEDCIVNIITETIATHNHARIASIKCPNEKCKICIFTGLSRRRRKRLESNVSASGDAGEVTIRNISKNAVPELEILNLNISLKKAGGNISRISTNSSTNGILSKQRLMLRKNDMRFQLQPLRSHFPGTAPPDSLLSELNVEGITSRTLVSLHSGSVMTLSNTFMDHKKPKLQKFDLRTYRANGGVEMGDLPALEAGLSISAISSSARNDYRKENSLPPSGRRPLTFPLTAIKATGVVKRLGVSLRTLTAPSTHTATGI